MIANTVVAENNSNEICSRIYDTARTIFSSDQIVELRVLYSNGRVDSGYYDDFYLLAETASRYDEDEDVYGIFWSLNPLHSSCLERSKNQMRERISSSRGDKTTSDADITEYRYLFVDVDPVREGKISSTNVELDAAKEKTREIVSFLRDLGWSCPWLGMSGSGMHLLYRVQLSNTEESRHVVKRILVGLSDKFSDEAVKIDISVGNPARICKVYYSRPKKGINTEDRPHRRSEFLGRAEDYYDIH